MTADDRTVERAERLRESAVLVALHTGLLRRCPVHGEIYDPGQHDFQGACMVASFMINRSDPLVASFRGNRDPLTDLLKSICTEYASSCPQCATTGAEPQPSSETTPAH